MPVAYRDNTGRVHIMHLAPNSKLSLTEIMAKDLPSWAIDPFLVSKNDLPVDRVFREAWTLEKRRQSSRIIEDVDKAKEVVVKRARQERETYFTELDKQQLIATGKKNIVEVEAIEDRKNRLRDMTKEMLPDTLNKLRKFKYKALEEYENGG